MEKWRIGGREAACVRGGAAVGWRLDTRGCGTTRYRRGNNAVAGVLLSRWVRGITAAFIKTMFYARMGARSAHAVRVLSSQ